jgi:hypothetical protein
VKAGTQAKSRHRYQGHVEPPDPECANRRQIGSGCETVAFGNRGCRYRALRKTRRDPIITKHWPVQNRNDHLMMSTRDSAI